MACHIEGVLIEDTVERKLKDFMAGAKGIKEIAKMHHDFYSKRRTDLINMVKKKRSEIMEVKDNRELFDTLSRGNKKGATAESDAHLSQTHRTPRGN
jgi:hypothetical protein